MVHFQRAKQKRGKKQNQQQHIESCNENDHNSLPFLNPNLHAVFAIVMLKSNTLLATTKKMGEIRRTLYDSKRLWTKRATESKRKTTDMKKRKKEKISNKKNTKTISSEQDFTDIAMQIARIQKHMHTER